MTYPGGFAVTYHYNSNGYLQEIRRGDNSPIWSCVNVDNEGNITQYKLSGENIIVDKSFNGNGYLKQIKTTAGTVKQWLTYSFDEKTGDLKLRRDTLRSLSEVLAYDTFDQGLLYNYNQLSVKYNEWVINRLLTKICFNSSFSLLPLISYLTLTMLLNPQSPRESINKAYLKTRPNRSQIELFKRNILNLLDNIKKHKSIFLNLKEDISTE